MSRGGRRPNAGRKNKIEFNSMRNVLEQSISNQQWEMLARNLFSQARKGNIRAAELLILCRFGGLTPPPEPENTEQIQIIEYRPMGDYPDLVPYVSKQD